GESTNDAGSDAGSTGAAATGATAGAATAAPSPSHDQSDHASGEGPGAPAPSRVIRTAHVALVIPRDTFEERFGEAVDVADKHGGFVADSSTRSRSGSLTLRVPAKAFGPALRELRALGTVEVQSVHGRDVSADYVDLNARLRIARSRREVLLGLMN